MFTFPAYAHIAPALPTLAELVRRGHRVSCFVAERFTEMVTAVGVDPVVYPSAFPWSDGIRGDGLEGMLHFFTEGHAPLRTAVELFRHDPPDLLAHDLAASEAARLLARERGVPVVQLCCTFASSADFSMTERQFAESTAPPPETPITADHPQIVAFLERRAALLRECGMVDLPLDGFGAEHGPNVVFLPKAFQIAPETFDDRFTFIGPALPAPPPANEGWRPPGGGRRVALLSLGSSYTPDQSSFLRFCAQALAEDDWHVVTTLGNRTRPEELGDLPRTVEIHPWLNHAEVLRHASVFVTHSGMGSVMESLDHGVPMVLVPFHEEQRVIAQQAQDLGLGRKLLRETISPDALRAAAEEAATSPRVRDAVASMRRQVRGCGGAALGADVIESLLDPARTPIPSRK
uniref:Glycosyltransferase n=1 Tax=Streptomyces sp. WAC2288 TaxID=1582798 RepID=A0A1I9J5K0_9ACTN|nr:glycosyltransferase [Streptomyces sp. WAC2288]